MTIYRRKQVLTIVALLVGIFGLSVGFASFSESLTISSSLIVKPDASTFRVVFSSDSNSLQTNDIVGVTSDGAEAGRASIENDGNTPTISDLTAKFTAPGQTVKYTFYAHNKGYYVAYLDSIQYENVVGESQKKVCTATDSENTSSSLLTAACNDISMTVDVGDVSVFGTVRDITGHSLDKDAFEKVVVTISYADNNNRSDGDFIVEFGDVLLRYKSQDNK